MQLNNFHFISVELKRCQNIRISVEIISNHNKFTTKTKQKKTILSFDNKCNNAKIDRNRLKFEINTVQMYLHFDLFKVKHWFSEANRISNKDTGKQTGKVKETFTKAANLVSIVAQGMCSFCCHVTGTEQERCIKMFCETNPSC